MASRGRPRKDGTPAQSKDSPDYTPPQGEPTYGFGQPTQSYDTPTPSLEDPTSPPATTVPQKPARKKKNPTNTLNNATDIKKIGDQVLRWTGVPFTDDPDLLMERAKEYLSWSYNNDSVPTYEEFALAVGTTRSTLKRWESHPPKPELKEFAQIFREHFAALGSKLAEGGKVNPVVYIFRAKNYYDMVNTDVVHYVSDDVSDNLSKDEILDRINKTIVEVDESQIDVE